MKINRALIRPTVVFGVALVSYLLVIIGGFIVFAGFVGDWQPVSRIGAFIGLPGVMGVLVLDYIPRIIKVFRPER